MGLFGRNKNMICRCKKITSEQIAAAIKNGANTYEDIKEATGAGTGMCKGRKCRSKIEEIIAENK